MGKNTSRDDNKMISLNIHKNDKKSSSTDDNVATDNMSIINPKWLIKKAPLPMNLNTRREFLCVSFCGCFFAFNSGYLNGCSLTGFNGLSNITIPVAGLTGTYTKAAVAIANHDDAFFIDAFAIISCFIFGSFLSGLMLPNEKPMLLSTKYGPLLLLEGFFLSSVCILSELEYKGIWLWYLLSIANGIIFIFLTYLYI